MEERFDNLTDEEVYGAIVEETPISKRRKKITLIFIAVIILIIWFSSGSPIKARSA